MADQAYDALRERRLDAAIQLFLRAIEEAPQNPALRKDLAYAYLKTGQTEAARDQFAAARRLDPGDFHAALEYAFLCYETGEKAEARRVFDDVRQRAVGGARATAEAAFQNIDRALAEGIERWRRAAEREPGNFSAHRELAELSELRGDLATAARHYEIAWRLKPAQRSLMLALGRVWAQSGRAADAMAILLAASRGAEPRVAEAARELLPERYPYVYEFREAIQWDPGNVPLHRELAYLLLAMGQKEAAELEFATVVEAAPDDLLAAAQLGFLRLERGDRAAAMPLLERVLQGNDAELADRVRFMLKMPRAMREASEAPRTKVSVEAKTFAEKSFERGYLVDALKYFHIAHEKDPVDFDVLLKLGWTHNLLRNDAAAASWFNLARRSPDPTLAAEAARAWRALTSGSQGLRLSVWMFPIYSTRWRDTFAYGQIKAEWKMPGLPLLPYLSVRFIGDHRGLTDASMPQLLSESAFVLGGGMRTPAWKGLTAWFEAGSAAGYRTGKFLPDYRGGLSYSRRLGKTLFHSVAYDAVFLSRFGNDAWLYAQNRTGIRAGPRVEIFWNSNLSVDVRGQSWANFAEAGPGAGFRLPSHAVLTISALRGAYIKPQHGLRRANYFDLRAGLWYAFSY